MTKTKILLTFSFLLTFAGGITVGMLVSWQDPPVATAPVVEKDRHGLTATLGLTEEQHKKIKEIWSSTMREGMPRMQMRRNLSKVRDEAISKLITDLQREEYDRIMAEYRAAVEEIYKAREKAFREAVEKTRTILTPEQAEKYDKMIKEHQNRGPRGPWGHSRDQGSQDKEASKKNGGTTNPPETKGQNGKDE